MRHTRSPVTAGLMALALIALAPAAAATDCPDPSNTDCPPPPSESQFAQLAADTTTFFGPGAIRTELIGLVQRAQDALYPPSPIHPPSPIRAYHHLTAYLNQVNALAGTPNGAGDGGAVVMHEVSAVRSQITAAFSSLHFPPGPPVRPRS